MTNISARTWVLFGFAISLVAVIINIFVLAGINDRIKEADGELSKLTNSLNNQATEISRAEIKNDLFTILNHISKQATGDAKTDAAHDAIYLLQSHLIRNYAAVNDIPVSEILKSENESSIYTLKYVEKAREMKQKADEGASKEEIQKLSAELEQIEAESEKAPKSELTKKLEEVISQANPEKLADQNTTDILFEISPYLRSSNDQFIANYQKKEVRIKELQDRKSNLSWWASIFTYLAVSLQLFGLMFVLTKDLVKDTKERREKAEKEAQKAEAEARQAQEEADEYNRMAEEARAEAVKAQEEAEEAEDRLEELKEEIKLAETEKVK